jgi:hypothetical protein
MFGISFDKSRIGIVTDNGDTHYDEINWIKKGANYDFPNVQYPSVSSIISNSNHLLPIRA